MKNTSNINCHRASISKMTNRNFILTLLVMFYQETVWTMDISRSVLLCFEKRTGNDGGWCNSTIMLCNTGIAQNFTIDVTFIKNLNDNPCGGFCDTRHKPVLSNDINNLPDICLRMECNMTDFMIPSHPDGNGGDNGFVNVTYSCTDNTDDGVETNNSTSIPTTKNSTRTTESNIFFTENNTMTAGTAQLSTDDGVETDNSTSIPTTKNSSRTTESNIFFTENNTITAGTAQYFSDSGDLYTVVIVVSVVVPIVIVVVVVAILMYRSSRGQCQLLLGKCTKRYAKHSPDRTDTHAMSSTVNSNLYCDLNRHIDVNDRDVDYCKIDKVGKESDIEYVN